MKKNLVCIGIMLIASIMTNYACAQATANYSIIRTIALTGNGRWDYLSVDEVNHKLYVSHGSQVNVIDLITDQQIAVIPETNGVHGIANANNLNKAYISCGSDSSVLIVDLINFKPIKKVHVTGKNPDAILYDQFSQKVFVFNGKSNNASVIDATNDKVIATISLPGNPEFSQTDDHGKIFVNIENKSCLVEIDATSLKVENIWPIAPGVEPSGLAFDSKNHRLFSVCANQMMVITNSNTGKVISTVPIGSEPDGVVFDPVAKCIFSSNGDGTMTIVQQKTADKYQVLENFPTHQGARTITIDNTSRHLYLPVADYSCGDRQKSVEPGTFKVIDIAPERPK